jgi:copper chaperone CopZ
MQRLTLELPAMYGDHHVTEVRELLGKIAGVGRVHASAAWQRVELEYDPGLTTAETIRQALLARGYGDGEHLPPVSPRTKSLTEFAIGAGATEQFVEKVPEWHGGFSPCPGFEVLHPAEVHPADR